jgi:hypothetical protein
MRNQRLLKRMIALATALMFLVVIIPARGKGTASYNLTPEQIEAALETQVEDHNWKDNHLGRHGNLQI